MSTQNSQHWFPIDVLRTARNFKLWCEPKKANHLAEKDITARRDEVQKRRIVLVLAMPFLIPAALGTPLGIGIAIAATARFFHLAFEAMHDMNLAPGESYTLAVQRSAVRFAKECQRELNETSSVHYENARRGWALPLHLRAV